MSILDTIASFIAPHECLGCSKEGALLCRSCLEGLPPVTGQLAHPALGRITAVTTYDGLARDLLWQLKSSGAQSAAAVMARAMARQLPTPVNRCYIVPVPTASSRVRQRGYDQAKLIARALARQTALPYRNCLVRTGQTHQVGASREQRLQQLEGSFRVKIRALPPGARLLLVDDVMTTGASLAAAATALKQAGAAQIEAIVFAAAPLNKS